MESNSEVAVQGRFRWGLILAWVPLAFFLVPAFMAVIKAQPNKATGLGAVGGGLTEATLQFGFVAIVASELGAIVMLVRTFSGTHPLRSVVALASIFSSVLLLVVLGAFLWLSVSPEGRIIGFHWHR